MAKFDASVHDNGPEEVLPSVTIQSPHEMQTGSIIGHLVLAFSVLRVQRCACLAGDLLDHVWVREDLDEQADEVSVLESEDIVVAIEVLLC